MSKVQRDHEQFEFDLREKQSEVDSAIKGTKKGLRFSSHSYNNFSDLIIILLFKNEKDAEIEKYYFLITWYLGRLNITMIYKDVAPSTAIDTMRAFTKGRHIRELVDQVGPIVEILFLIVHRGLDHGIPMLMILTDPVGSHH
uniref:CRAL-TRIO domain-containing protein n=1 Tax=Heterorhabditis bacteriophora TaxID=37862 RepID=A0A1I7XHS8_HETBA